MYLYFNQSNLFLQIQNPTKPNTLEPRFMFPPSGGRPSPTTTKGEGARRTRAQKEKGNPSSPGHHLLRARPPPPPPGRPEAGEKPENERA